MHIAEGFLPPAHAIGWTVAAAPFVVHGARAVVREVRENPESTLLLGAAGAFTFVLSAIKLPSVTGSSSHPTGTGAGAILFRPPVMALVGTVVLLFQALLLAHGGLTTLGANAVAFAVVGPWAGYGAYRLVRLLRGGLLPAVFAGMGVPGDVLGDDALLARARLERPWALTVGARLLPEGTLPRDVAGLLAALPDRPGVPS